MPFDQVGGLTLHYRVSGPRGAVRVAFINSLGTDCRIWDDLADATAGQVRCLRYDQRGQGLSDSPPGPYSVGDHADDLLGLLERLEWGPSVLCGLSIGGMIAMEACLRRPRAVRGLVLSDTCPKIGDTSFWDGRIAQIRRQGVEPIAESVMERWFGASFHRERSVTAAGWANLLKRTPVEGYLGSCSALREADLTDAVPRISAPALCVCGSEDASTTPAEVRALARLLPQAEYAEVEGAGHLVPVERPGQFAGLLNGFLEQQLGD